MNCVKQKQQYGTVLNREQNSFFEEKLTQSIDQRLTNELLW